LQYILKCNLFLVMAKLNFQHHYSSLQSRDPSEIILIGWFSTQEAFLIIINVENKLRSLIFVETMIHFFRIIWWMLSEKAANYARVSGSSKCEQHIQRQYLPSQLPT